MTDSDSLVFNTLLAHTSVGIAVSDVDGRLAMMSPALEELLGQTFAPWSESDWSRQFDVWSEDGSERLLAEELPLVRARAGEVVKDAIISTHNAHRITYLRCNAAPLYDDDGLICGAIVLVQDVTIERTAMRKQEELRRRIVGTVNHEFRTPLTALLGHVELLQDASEGASENVLHSLSTVANAGERLRVLVQTISELMDLEVNAQASRELSDINGLVRQVAADLGASALGRGMSIQVDCRDPAPALVDSAKLRKAIAALVENGLVHGPSGSPVTIHTCGDDTWSQVSVSDVGPGIPALDRNRLIHPFESGNTSDDWASSRGLGLAVASTVATAHGGRLLLADNKPRGLVATLLIPRQVNVPATASTEPPHEAGEPCPWPEVDAASHD